MAETIFKTFRPEVKAVNEATGEIDMLIPMSTASTDRDGESIDPLGWRKSLPAFRKRPVLLSSHNYGDLRKQIGEFSKVKVSEDGLFASPRYYINEGNEEADWAFKLASKGMAAYSVGFIPKAWTDGDGEKTPARTYTEQELLEISHVVVPSNRDAIQGLRGKSKDPTINQVVEDIITDLSGAPVVDLAGEKVPDHPIKKEYSQQEIADEIDFVRSLVNGNGMSEETRAQAWELVREIMRITGTDIPEDIKGALWPRIIVEPPPTKSNDDRIKVIIDQTVSHVVNQIRR
jgi:HK97 family phage prohead protease